MPAPIPPAARRIRLLIADDESLFREALRLLLESDPNLEVVACASDGSEAVALAQRLKPDVLLLDLAMPGRSGLDVVTEVSGTAPDVRTIIVTGSTTEPDVLTALQRGARGVVRKDASPEMLFKSIHTVMKGQYWISRDALADLVNVLRQSPPVSPPLPPRPFTLTRRELQIVARVARGCSNKEIASDLGITNDTVKHHLTNIFDKVGISTRLELALFAMHHSLV